MMMAAAGPGHSSPERLLAVSPYIWVRLTTGTPHTLRGPQLMFRIVAAPRYYQLSAKALDGGVSTHQVRGSADQNPRSTYVSKMQK